MLEINTQQLQTTHKDNLFDMITQKKFMIKEILINSRKINNPINNSVFRF